MRVILAILTALLIASPAFAEKVTANGMLTNTQAVTFTVGDKPGHQIYLTKMEGMVQSAGVLNNARYEITDLSDTAGQSGGYKTFTLPDGSKIFAKYEVTEPGDKPKGKITFTGGTGKYEGITGTGTYSAKFTDQTYTSLRDTLELDYTLK
jgi:hypothetical protein